MNRYPANVILIMILSLFLSPGISQAQAPASVRDLIVIGLKNNIGLQIERLNIPLATEAIMVDEAAFDAELFAAAGYSEASIPLSTAYSLTLTDHSDSDALTGEFGLRKKYTSGLMASLALFSDWTEDNNLTDDLAPRYRSALNLTLTQPLLRGSGTATNTTNLQISRNRQSQSYLTHLLQAQGLALQIELLAGQFAGDTEIAALRMQAVALAQNLYVANQRRFAAGVIAISEVQEAETALANRALNLSLAQQAKDLQFEGLNRQLNHVLPVTYNPAPLYSFASDIDSFNLPGIEPMFSAAREKSIPLQLGRIDSKISSIQLDFYENQLQPRLDLNLQAELNGLSGDERNSSVNNRYAGGWGDSFAGVAAADGYQWSAGLEFSLPLGNRMAKSRLQQAELQRRQTSFQQTDLATELRTDLQRQTISLQRAYEQVQIAERFERLAGLSLQQEQRRLDEGLSDTFRIISFQDNMVNAKIGRVKALVQYYSSSARLNFTRGIILEQHAIKLQDTEEKSLEIM